ncbi:MAG: radical SAM family heme chaperone HemW [Candidatus Fermentibacteraceae bacterium]
MAAGWGVYAHVPFCASRCSYCAFHSRPLRDSHPSAYMDALPRELEEAVPPDLEVDTVYIGGGTPTVLPAEFLCSLLLRLRERADLSGLREATVEANPATVDQVSLGILRRGGFDRISLGVQSLHHRHLRLLGRAHDALRAVDAFEEARSAGFRRISVDLIYGIPGQTSLELEEDLRRIVQLGPEHISAYELTLEPGTGMARLCSSGRLRQQGEGELLEMHRLVHRILAAAGYRHYEVSSYARGEGEISLHNSACWQGGPYLGLGPSAHSFDGRRRRWWNAPDTVGWAGALLTGRTPPGGGEEVTDLQRADEMAMLGLRTSRGVRLERIRAETGLVPSEDAAARLGEWTRRGLLRITGDSIVPTSEGMLAADGIAASLEWSRPGPQSRFWVE